uniref:Secreted protein n=1 Tax=Romanomermis culicivorax TaxID=13658 RepID=A0A915HL41_ROMCU
MQVHRVCFLLITAKKVESSFLFILGEYWPRGGFLFELLSSYSVSQLFNDSVVENESSPSRPSPPLQSNVWAWVAARTA